MCWANNDDIRSTYLNRNVGFAWIQSSCFYSVGLCWFLMRIDGKMNAKRNFDFHSPLSSLYSTLINLCTRNGLHGNGARLNFHAMLTRACLTIQYASSDFPGFLPHFWLVRVFLFVWNFATPFHLPYSIYLQTCIAKIKTKQDVKRYVQKQNITKTKKSRFCMFLDTLWNTQWLGQDKQERAA